MVVALREHQKRQDNERAAAGDKWEDTGFVFTTRQGRPMSPYTLVSYWHDVRDAAGLGTLRLLSRPGARYRGCSRPVSKK